MSNWSNWPNDLILLFRANSWYWLVARGWDIPLKSPYRESIYLLNYNLYGENENLLF